MTAAFLAALTIATTPASDGGSPEAVPAPLPAATITVQPEQSVLESEPDRIRQQPTTPQRASTTPPREPALQQRDPATAPPPAVQRRIDKRSRRIARRQALYGSREDLRERRPILAQQRGILSNFIGGDGVVRGGPRLAELIQQQIAPVQAQGAGAAGQPALLQQRGGAPAAAQGANQVQSFIDLIQQTIKPESWEENGGRGTIAPFGR